MENNEIMYEEYEVTEEETTTGSGKGLKIAAGVGIATIVGALAYKFIAKPVIAKIKAKKEQKALAESGNTADCEATDEN